MNLLGIGWFFSVAGLLARVFYSASTASPNQRNLALFAAIGGAALVAFGQALARQQVPWIRSPFAWAAFILLGVAGLSGPFEAESAQALAERFTCLLLAFSLPATLQDPRRRAALLASCLGAVFLIACLGLCQRLYLFDLLRGEIPAVKDPDLRAFFDSTRARGPFGQANAFAGGLALAVPFLVLWFLGEVSARGRRAAIFAALLLGTAFLASGSRGGSWALACGLAAVFCDRRVRRAHPRTRLLAAGLATLALGGWATWAAVMAGWWTPDPEGWFQTLVLRRDYATTAARVFHDHPGAGVGFGFLGHYMADYREPGDGFSRLAHNGYLSTLAEVGLIVGGLSILVLTRALLRRRDEAEAAVPTGRLWALWAPLAGGLLLAAWGGDVLFVVGADGDPVRALNGLIALGAALVLVRLLGVPAAKCLAAEPWRLRVAARGTAVAFLAHALVDTGFYVPNLLALLVALSVLSFEGRAPRKGSPLEGLTIGFVLIGLLGAWLVASTPYARAAPLIERERALSGVPLPSTLGAEVTLAARRAADARPFHLRSLGRAIDALALSRSMDAIREAQRLASGRRELLLQLPAYRRRVRALFDFWRQIDAAGGSPDPEVFLRFERAYRGI